MIRTQVKKHIIGTKMKNKVYYREETNKGGLKQKY